MPFSTIAAMNGSSLPDAKKTDLGGGPISMNLLQPLPLEANDVMANMDKNEPPLDEAEKDEEKKDKEGKEEEKKEADEGESPNEEAMEGGEQKRKKKKSKKKKNKKKKVKVAREILKPGTVVSGLRDNPIIWVVKSLLGSGGFGDVYKVAKENETDKKEYALKTEANLGDSRLLRLKVEAMVLGLVNNRFDKTKKKHFLSMIDTGRNDKYKFIVMDLVGPSIEDIRKKTLKTDFAFHSAFFIAVQTLESLRDLHEIGWLHRDIKPANFAIGLDDKIDVVYMLDFGIAKNIFMKGTNEMKAQRKSVKFLGTTRFASRACHLCKEQGRKDDVETWLYMVFDVFDFMNGLPWKKTIDKEKIVQQKTQFFKHIDFNVRTVPFNMMSIVKYVDSLAYADIVYYPKIFRVLFDEVGKELGIDMTRKVDWFEKRPTVPKNVDDDDSSSGGNHQSGSASHSGKEDKKKVDEKKKTVDRPEQWNNLTRQQTSRNTTSDGTTAGGTTGGGTTGGPPGTRTHDGGGNKKKKSKNSKKKKSKKPKGSKDKKTKKDKKKASKK